MKILLDECVPSRLAKSLPGHDVSTVRQMNWLGLSNGKLLDAAAEFNLFITVDKNLVSQQNLQGRTLAVAVLRSKSNKLDDILPLVPQLLKMLADLKPGSVTTIS